MFAEIQERQTMEKLERQKRIKEGQQLLERLRESDLLIDQLWPSLPKPRFEGKRFPSLLDDTPGPRSQPVDIDQLWPDPPRPILEADRRTPSPSEATPGPSSQHVDIDQLWPDPPGPKLEADGRTPSPSEDTPGPSSQHVDPQNIEGIGQSNGAVQHEDKPEQLAPEIDQGGPAPEDAGIPVPAAEEPAGPQDQAGGFRPEMEAVTKEDLLQLISTLGSVEQRLLGRVSAMENRMLGNTQGWRALSREVRALRAQVAALQQPRIDVQFVHNSAKLLFVNSPVNSCNIVFH
ncbi:uncharacterized protein LOC143838855 [Paroedura picta]|uniref:uncharacterized protein LOC143838855 n=1 Tax=Paroedura picta TaxID=143630 RepID=UPI0040562F03